ncbi:dephospho-CoA kinase [Rubidibacter lacunae KORDI 51-2]|uniref:Dephospho-CoA kinase n=1 Tax=Rubidibacter lacunae KORDI 51-2 TaxID=582515 RepID=U5DGE9_9CHRO|nr:dephospho-CoA kinase [Rubidibacter lacunae]ERN40666.1 dephospho-CoA kinase [Rubidibacter lacunae KORDI 51-2]
MCSEPLRAIAVTGGIATGKSTVADYLAERHGLPVFDADLFAREAVAPQTEILQRIRDRYGRQIVLRDGSLHRRALGDIIFSDRAERQWLEAQIHPYVRDRLRQALDQLTIPTAAIVVPLLFEADMTDLATEIWVVSCSEAQQLARLQARDELESDLARARIDTQMPLSAKIAAADVVLDNSSARDSLYAQIDAALLHT